MGKDQVIIYCGMHGLYEKANHTGYTNDPRRAGIYERSKVEDLLGSPYSDRKNELLPVPEDHETRIAERIASLTAERDALAAQNLELRGEREGVRWVATSDALRSRAIALYRDRFVCAEHHGGEVACWWTSKPFNERSIQYFDTAPSLDAAKAAAIQWVDQQEGE